MTTSRAVSADHAAILAHHGELLELTTDSLHLDDPRILWTVVEGAVDLFAVEILDGQPVGRWHFVSRMRVGHTVAGFPPGPRHQVLARPVRGAKIRRVTIADTTGVLALADDEDEDATLRARATLRLEALTFSIARGLEGLAAQLVDGPAPRRFVALEREASVELAARNSVRSVDGVLWTRVETGRLRLRNAGSSARYAGEIFPATEDDWYVAGEGGAVVTTHPPMSLMRAGTLWSALALHQVRLLYTLDHRAESQLLSARQALVDGSNYDRQLSESATRSLASVLQNGRLRIRLADIALDAPLLAAVKLVADRLGLDVVEPRADEHARTTADPLQRIAQASRFRTRTVRLDGRWWKEDLGPLIAYRVRDGEPIALLPDRRGYAVVEPGAVTATYLTAATAAQFDVDAVTFYRPLPDRAITPRELFRFGMFGARRDVARFAVTLGVVAALGLVVPLVTGTVLGTFVPQAQTGLAVRACLLVIALSVVNAVLTIVQNHALLRIEGRLDTQAQAALWDRLMSLPLGFFSRYSVGELSGVALGISAMREALSGIAVTAISSLVIGVANLVLLVVVAPGLSLVVLGIVAVGMLVAGVCGRAQVRAQREVVSLDQQLSARVYALLTGLAKLRVAAAEARAYAHWSTMFARSREMSLRARRIQNVLTTFNAVYFVLGALVVFAAMSGPFHGSIGTATFLVFFVAFNQMLSSTTQFTGATIAVLNVVPMAENIRPVLEALPEARAESKDPGDLDGRIELNQVSFSYAAGTAPVIDNVSLHIEEGEFVAVVGPTGCGKSTLLRLLLGFDRPSRGTILYDDQDLQSLDVTAVRRQCGVVLQSGGVLAGDILTAITGTGRYTVDDAWAAARMTGLADDIAAMPMGMHTVVADGGGGLSGGQRQRLMIARALISRPRIVFFDEATSALDNPTQQVIAESTRRLRATRVVIAHRLSTVIDADRIVVMDAGRIVQSGTYSELYEDTAGVFHSLVRRQVI